MVSLKKFLMRHWWLLREESQNHISLKLIQKLKKQEIFILIKWCTVSISSSYCEKWNTQSLLFRYENRWLISANVKCFHILFTCSFYFFYFLKLGLYHNILNNVIHPSNTRKIWNWELKNLFKVQPWKGLSSFRFWKTLRNFKKYWKAIQ